MDIDAMAIQLRQLREKVDALVTRVFPNGLPQLIGGDPRTWSPDPNINAARAQTDVTASAEEPAAAEGADEEVEEVEEHDEATGEKTRRVRRKRR